MNASLVRHVLVLTVAVASACLAVRAQTPAPTGSPAPADPTTPATVGTQPAYDQFTLRAGAFVLSNIKATLSLDTLNGDEGDDLDFVEDLGGKDSLSLFRADGEWRFARRHKLGLSWFDIQQSATHELTGEIEWGGETYPIDTVVESDFGVTVSKINYGYAFVSRGDHEVFALIGTHVTRLEAGVSAPDLGRAERLGVTAPLPVIGLEWKYRIAERLRAQVSYEYFGISLDDTYEGSLSDFVVLLEYAATEHLSLGAGFNRYILRVSVEGENLKLSLKHSYDGLMAYLTARF